MAGIGISTLAQTLRRLAIAIRAGMDVRTVWDKESRRGTAGYRQQAATVRDHVAAGDTMAEAMGACGDYFPQFTRDLVDVGEKTGRLDEVLYGLADHYDHLLTLRRSFLIGIAWPSLQLVVALGVIGLLILVLGMIGGGPGGEPIDILGFGLVGPSGLMVYLMLIGLVFGGGALAVVAVLRGWFGTAPLQMAMQVPGLGGYLRTSALSRMAWALSLSLNSGLDARRSMELALRSTHNAYYTSKMHEVDESLLAGREFHESLRATGIFPDDFLDSLEAAEVSGTHGETLTRLASDYRERAQSAARTLTVAATAGVWILVAGFLIFMIFRLAFFYIGTITNALEGF